MRSYELKEGEQKKRRKKGKKEEKKNCVRFFAVKQQLSARSNNL